ncbi:MAG: hypothetical protein C0506_02855 [Anaerolinea sp.]|nr:hypothetical protein [Anaerolinea sp.]
MENPEAFFARIRREVSIAFEQSDIRKRQTDLGESWNYSICGLPLRPRKPLLLGLKWGADSAIRHAPQDTMPTSSAYSSVVRYPFIDRSLPYLARYFGSLEQSNYLNVLPFRAPDLSYLTPRDWDLGIGAFFAPVMEYLRPPLTLILGTTAVNQMAPHVRLEYSTVSVTSNAKNVNAHVGVIVGSGARHPFIALPHPNNRLTGDARSRIWAAAFEAASTH